MTLNESIVEDAALEWFGELGYSCLGAEALTPALSHGERESYSEVVVLGRLREAIRRLNPAIPTRTLATLRDTLLPKLLSGELAVGAALREPILSKKSMPSMKGGMDRMDPRATSKKSIQR